MKMRLNWTFVQYAIESGVYWFRAKDVASALCYTDPKGAARRMDSAKYLRLSTEPTGRQLCKVITVDQMLSYASARSQHMLFRIKADLDTNGVTYKPVALDTKAVYATRRKAGTITRYRLAAVVWLIT